MAKFITIGERISVTAPSIRKAFAERDPEPIIARCEQQLKAGANYIDVNIGPAEADGEEVMQWAVKLLQERGVDAIIGTHPHYVQQMTYDPESGQFVAYSLGDFLSDGERSGTEYSVILQLEITKSAAQTKITGYSYTPIFSVAERGMPLRSMRIRESIAAYESNYIKRVTDRTYESMTYALGRIDARIQGDKK